MTAKILTANRLTDGISVWMSASGEWETSISAGLIARHEEAVEALVGIGVRAQAENRVIDVAVIDVEDTPEGPRALRLRERIRAHGPSVEYLPADNARANRAA